MLLTNIKVFCRESKMIENKMFPQKSIIKKVVCLFKGYLEWYQNMMVEKTLNITFGI